MKAIIFCFLIAVTLARTIPFVDTFADIKDGACIRNTYSRAAFRGYQSIGKVDPFLMKNLEAAKKVGLKADVYMIPCTYCGNPEKQADEIMYLLKSATYETLWISIEGSWSLDRAKNQVFMKNLTTALTSKGAKLGIFTFQPTWDRVFGKEFTEFSTLPLWYIRWNSNLEAADFIPFGGWKNPTAKQCDSDNIECDINTDSDSFFEPDAQ